MIFAEGEDTKHLHLAHIETYYSRQRPWPRDPAPHSWEPHHRTSISSSVDNPKSSHSLRQGVQHLLPAALVLPTGQFDSHFTWVALELDTLGSPQTALGTLRLEGKGMALCSCLKSTQAATYPSPIDPKPQSKTQSLFAPSLKYSQMMPSSWGEEEEGGIEATKVIPGPASG